MPPISASTIPHRRKKSWRIAAATIAVGVFVGLSVGEIGLRLSGRHPWRCAAEKGWPISAEPDAILGWRRIPGRYQMPAFVPNGAATQMTIWPSGGRATAAAERPTRNSLAIVGCSFTEGTGISDWETYPWKLQERFPQIDVRNYAVAAYGTYQCLCVLEQLFSESRPSDLPKMVLYGFIDHHEDRNVADFNWLEILAQESSRGFVNVPYATLEDDGAIRRHPPEGYIALPLRERLALVALFERGLMKWRCRGRRKQKRQITERLLLDMQHLCSAHGVPFAIVFLRVENEARSHYQNFCRGHGIELIDCAYPMSADMKVPGDRHPNGKLTSLWVEDLDEALRERIVTLKIETGPAQIPYRAP